MEATLAQNYPDWKAWVLIKAVFGCFQALFASSLHVRYDMLKAWCWYRLASASIIRSASYTCGATVRCGGFKDTQFED
jgi:hypothetical protein